MYASVLRFLYSREICLRSRKNHRMAQQPFFLGVGPTTSLTSEKRWKLCACAAACEDDVGITCGER